MDKQNNITYREWAPGASQAFLIGDFSISHPHCSRFPLMRASTDSTDDWNRESHPMKKDPYGVFEVHVPAKGGQPAIAHNSKVKVSRPQRFHLPTNSLALLDHPVRPANRAHTSMDQICHTRSFSLSSLRCSIVEPSYLRTIRFQTSQTEEATKRKSIRSTCWDIFSGIKSSYL